MYCLDVLLELLHSMLCKGRLDKINDKQHSQNLSIKMYLLLFLRPCP